MKCPFCGFINDKVVDSRETKEGESIRRRRECVSCGRRFTSYEQIDDIPYMVVKHDGSREEFSRKKLLSGLLKACEKRVVATRSLEAIVGEAEAMLHDREDREITTREIGAFVMERLGFPTRNYYLGWSEWGNAEETPVESGSPRDEKP